LILPGHGTDNGSVRPVIELVIVFLLPTAAVYAIIGGFRVAGWAAEHVHARRHRLDAPAEPIERLGANLRRLRAEFDATETRPGVPAKSLRLRALRGAYVDALCTACERLDVSPPLGGERAPLAEIYRVEAALRERGLDVRQPVAH
jgi:hypothetical protein